MGQLRNELCSLRMYHWGPRYSGRPNIKGGFALRPVADFGYLSGSIIQTKGATETADCALNEGSRHSYQQYSFDASVSSPIYQNGLTEIRVNGLFGMMLIRSH